LKIPHSSVSEFRVLSQLNFTRNLQRSIPAITKFGPMSIVSVLATGCSAERAVWLSYGFYLLNLLIPIIPAVVIYWLFPEGKIKAAPAVRRQLQQGAGHPPEANTEEDPARSSIEGSIGGWKIKAAGAWGAYVTAFVLGYWTVNSTATQLIKAVGGASVWTVDSDVKLIDENGKEIPNEAIDKLIVQPANPYTFGNHATFTLFSPTLDPPEKLQVHLPNYHDEPIALKEFPAQDGKITLAGIKLTRLPPPMRAFQLRNRCQRGSRPLR
jgi:hypothetical protein